MSKRQVELNQQLARCALASDVLDLVDRHVDEFNVVNCGTALQRLAKSPDGRRALAGPAAARVDPLLAAAADLVGKHARHVESRQLASLLHACGKLGLGDRASTLVDRVETAAKLHASKFNPQELANAAWGAAKLGLNPRRDVVRELLSAVATSLERHASNPAASASGPGPGRDHRRRPDVGWTPQGVSNVAWSLATLGLTVDRADTNADTPETRGFRAVFAAVAARSRDFNPQEVANTLWAISRSTADVGAGAEDDEDDDDGERASEPRAGADSGADPGADLGARRAALALASRITRGWIASQRLEPQHAANISWACAKLHLAGDDVPGALADAAVAAAPRMNTQELSMTAWSAAAFGRSDAADALARAFAARAAEATPQQLATTARAFAKLGERRDALLDAVADALVAIVDGAQKRGDAGRTGDRTGDSGDVRLALKPQDVANLAWALAKLGCARRRDAFDALSRVARAHLKTARAARADDGDATRVAYRYTTQQLTMLTWAHGMLAHEDEGLLRACVKEIRDRLGEFNTRDLTNTAWALDALGVRASDKPKLIERFGRAARRHLDAFNSQELLKFLGAFERLGGNDAKLAAAVSAQRTLRYRFPAIDADVELSSKTPTSYRGTGKSRVDDSCGGSGRGNTGVTLWEGSFVLAEWLSRRGEPGASEDVVNATDGAWAGATWEGKVGVELGAGLGLPSIVAAKLGVKMVATDGTGKRRESPRDESRRRRRLDPRNPEPREKRQPRIALVNPSTGPHRVPGVSKRADMRHLKVSLTAIASGR
jgi:hypothetical protein